MGWVEHFEFEKVVTCSCFEPCARDQEIASSSTHVSDHKEGFLGQSWNLFELNYIDLCALRMLACYLASMNVTVFTTLNITHLPK